MDEAALQKSLDAIVERHEILRTTFKIAGEQPVQVVHPRQQAEFSVTRLEVSGAADPTETAIRLATAEIEKPLDLERGPLFRTKLYTLQENRHLLVIMFHQIIVDGWSNGIFVEELAQFYAAYSSGNTPALKPLPVQYADFAQWQHRWMAGGERIERQLEYWKKELSGALPTLELETDHPRPLKESFDGAQETLVLPEALTVKLKKFSQREGTTLFMTLLAVYDLLLRHCSKQDEVLVGSPVGGRARLETEKLIGFFANTVVLRARLAGELTGRELLRNIRQTSLGAYANADLPFEKLVEELQRDRRQQTRGLFQVWFGFIDTLPTVQAGNVQIKVSNPPIAPSQFDIALLVAEKPTETVCLFEYKTALFERETIQKIANDFALLAELFVDHPELSLNELEEKICEAHAQNTREQQQIFKQSLGQKLKQARRKAVVH